VEGPAAFAPEGGGGRPSGDCASTSSASRRSAARASSTAASSASLVVRVELAGEAGCPLDPAELLRIGDASYRTSRG
jgi:hypothetical protein